MALNRLIGTPHVDPQPFIDTMKKPPYRDIRHTLRGPSSVARWTWHQQCRNHVSLPYAHLSRATTDCACLVPEKHVTHVTRERVCLVYALMTRMTINVGVVIKNVSKRARGVAMKKTKEPEGINGPVLSFNEHNARIDNMLSHLYDMQSSTSLLRMNGVTEEQLQQLNMDYPMSEHSRALCRVGPGYEEPLDDDVVTEDQMARVDSDIESSDDDDEDSEMGEAALVPTDNKE
ncbi:hypothetical protein HAX54_036478 [Datura stramonium]|uniref:Uncharacterized protein n=1 Tax=Datura stramonium TaxID=4076 RepID=A0ABS8VGY6_DATST|nr:hypothetical protein [Datura stramonium]